VTPLTPSNTARGAGETCTQRRNDKEEARPVKLNQERLGLLRAEHQQDSRGHSLQCTTVQIQPGRRAKGADDLNQHQRLCHKAPSQILPKKYLNIWEGILA